jgi:hypothetical protein
MWEGCSAAPGHSEHEVDRYTKGLGAVYVGKAGRVSNDGIRDKGLPRHRILLQARVPKLPQHLLDHVAFLLYLAGYEASHAWDQARILDHIGHQLGWVSTDWVELETGISNKVAEHVVGRQADTVTVPLELGTECDERLNVSSAADNLDDDVELRSPRSRLRRRISGSGILRQWGLGDPPSVRVVQRCKRT